VLPRKSSSACSSVLLGSPPGQLAIPLRSSYPHIPLPSLASLPQSQGFVSVQQSPWHLPSVPISVSQQPRPWHIQSDRPDSVATRKGCVINDQSSLFLNLFDWQSVFRYAGTNIVDGLSQPKRLKPIRFLRRNSKI
jgi:hypothetical protein